MSAPNRVIMDKSIPSNTAGRLENKPWGVTETALRQEDQYKRKIVPKTYEPNERTSTMSFKAPMSDEKRLAILKLKEAEKEPTGFYGAMNYITGPVRFLASAFTSKPKDEKKDKNKRHSPNSPSSTRSSSPKSTSVPQKVSHEPATMAGVPEKVASEKEAPLTNSVFQNSTQVPPTVLLSDEPENVPKRKAQPVIIPKDSVEAKKHQALDNIKSALRARQKVQLGIDERPPKVQPQLMSDSSTKPLATTMRDVKITSNKYSYRISSTYPKPTVSTPPPVLRKRDPNKPNPPAPIRVTSGNANPDEKAIKVKVKSTGRTNRAAAWSSPNLNKKSPKKVSNTFENVAETLVSETLSDTVQRTISKPIPTQLNNIPTRRLPVRHLITGKTDLSATLNRSNSACIIAPSSSLVHCSNERATEDNLLFDANGSNKTKSSVSLQQSQLFGNSSNNHRNNYEAQTKNTVSLKTQPIVPHSSHSPGIGSVNRSDVSSLSAPHLSSGTDASEAATSKMAKEPEPKLPSRQHLRTISLGSPPSRKPFVNREEGSSAVKATKTAAAPKKIIKRMSSKDRMKNRTPYISTKVDRSPQPFVPVTKKSVKSPIDVRKEHRQVIEKVSRPVPSKLHYKSPVSEAKPEDFSMIDNAKAPDLSVHEELPKSGSNSKGPMSRNSIQKQESAKNVPYVAPPRFFSQANSLPAVPPEEPKVQTTDVIVGKNDVEEKTDARRLSAFWEAATSIVTTAVKRATSFKDSTDEAEDSKLIRHNPVQSVVPEAPEAQNADPSQNQNASPLSQKMTEEPSEQEDLSDRSNQGVAHHVMEAIETGEFP